MIEGVRRSMRTTSGANWVRVAPSLAHGGLVRGGRPARREVLVQVTDRLRPRLGVEHVELFGRDAVLAHVAIDGLACGGELGHVLERTDDVPQCVLVRVEREQEVSQPASDGRGTGAACLSPASAPCLLRPSPVLPDPSRHPPNSPSTAPPLRNQARVRRRAASKGGGPGDGRGVGWAAHGARHSDDSILPCLLMVICSTMRPTRVSSRVG